MVTEFAYTGSEDPKLAIPPATEFPPATFVRESTFTEFELET
jgi:hypothetical protein